jgi:hypothetical protein
LGGESGMAILMPRTKTKELDVVESKLTARSI